MAVEGSTAGVRDETRVIEEEKAQAPQELSAYLTQISVPPGGSAQLNISSGESLEGTCHLK